MQQKLITKGIFNMRKLIVTLMATIACCLTQAQTPLLLGKSHAMQRVKVEK